MSAVLAINRLPLVLPAACFCDVLLHSGWSMQSYGIGCREALANTSLIQPCYGWEKVTMDELALQGKFHVLPEVLFTQRVYANASSNLKNAAEEAHSFAPQAKSLGRSTRLRLLQGHVTAVFRQRLSLTERAKCLWAIGRCLGQFGKW